LDYSADASLVSPALFEMPPDAREFTPAGSVISNVA